MSTKQRMQAVKELECTHYYMSIYRRDRDKMTDETCANFYAMVTAPNQAYPCCQRAKGEVHPGQVDSLYSLKTGIIFITP